MHPILFGCVLGFLFCSRWRILAKDKQVTLINSEMNRNLVQTSESKTMLNIGACYPRLMKENEVNKDGIPYGLLIFHL